MADRPWLTLLCIFRLTSRGLTTLRATLLLVFLTVIFASPASAKVLADKSVSFAHLDLTKDEAGAQEVVFDVPAPGYVTIKIWVDPYWGCGKSPYQSVTFRWERETLPFEKRLISKSLQKGQRATYSEGVPIYHETTYQAYRPFHGIHAWLHPARAPSPSSGWKQFGQIVRLVVEYSAMTPSAVAPETSTKP